MKTMKMFAVSILLGIAGSAFAQTQVQAKEDVTLSDVIVAIEKINSKLGKDAKKEMTAKNDNQGPGGGPNFDFRYFLDMGTMNAYLDARGSYGDFGNIMYPMANSGGGTWRYSLDRNFQIGWMSWGGGFSAKGFKKANSVDTIDMDADGFDDYYSWANYGMSVNDFLMQYKIEIAPDFLYVAGGGFVGLGSMSFNLEQNQRSFTDSVVAAFTGSSDWNRMLLDTGAYISLQVQPDKNARWFRFGFTGGFDYPVPMGNWEPSAGVHKDELAPSAAFIPMNAYAGFNLDFNY